MSDYLATDEQKYAAVKPLEWIRGSYSTRSTCGKYAGLHCENGQWVSMGTRAIKSAETQAEFEDAADADNAHRILSAITLRHEADVRAEGMRVGAAREKMRVLTEWLNEDEDNGELLMASLDAKTIETLRAILAAIPVTK